MKWISDIIKIGTAVAGIIMAVFYLGGNQANISTSISSNSKSVMELKSDIKEGNKKIIALLEKVTEKETANKLQIAENKNNINWILKKR